MYRKLHHNLPVSRNCLHLSTAGCLRLKCVHTRSLFWVNQSICGPIFLILKLFKRENPWRWLPKFNTANNKNLFKKKRSRRDLMVRFPLSKRNIMGSFPICFQRECFRKFWTLNMNKNWVAHKGVRTLVLQAGN